MPTNQQIAAAREQGTIADAMMEEFLVGQQQQQQQQPPPLPPQNTAGMANLYVDNQAPAAVQDPLAVDSRRGQQAAATTAASDGPIQRFITDAHAQTTNTKITGDR
jgi:hypothetical protein